MAPEIPIGAQPVTMEGIAALLQSTFQLVQAAVNTVIVELDELKAHVQENETIMQANVTNLQGGINKLGVDFGLTVARVAMLAPSYEAAGLHEHQRH